MVSLRPVAIYDRVSTTDQEAGAARDRLWSAAAARGGRVALEVEETGSGAANDRPGLQRVLQAARAGQVAEVLVFKLDRFGRSALDLLTNIRQLVDCGCVFVAVSQGLVCGGGDAISMLLLSVLAGVAEYERELIRERTRLGLARARARGVQLGRRRAEQAPDYDQVAQLRALDYSWTYIGAELGCSASAARRAWERGLVEKGVKPARRGLA